MRHFIKKGTNEVFGYDPETQQYLSQRAISLGWQELGDWPPSKTSEDLATQARAKRNTLLAASDWTQVADAPVDQAAWATYRQELRDITAQAGFPENISWPVAP